jgi:predicted ABC-type ATPase
VPARPRLDLIPDLVVGERIDRDLIARGIDEADPARAALAAGRDAIVRVERALAARLDFTVKTTLSGRQPLELMQGARSAGYHVSLVFVDTADPRLNIERIRRRVAAGGHASQTTMSCGGLKAA